MPQELLQTDDPVIARLSRFALCIAPDSDHAMSALEAVKPTLTQEQDDALGTAFRRLLDQLEIVAEKRLVPAGLPPNSLVARFSFLPYHQRVAFALVVIEEFSIDGAAAIMDLEDRDVRALLLASRDFLFARDWTARHDT